MSFYPLYQRYRQIDFEHHLRQLTSADIHRILSKQKITEFDFLALLSPAAEGLLEPMAQKARQLSLQHFGKAILFFTPIYVANHCVNSCAYCGFNATNKISRKKLTLAQIEQEARAIADTGLRHVLLLTGESKAMSPVSYIVDAVKVLKRYFHSVGIEIYPLTEAEYAEVIDAGVDGLTIYQEAYHEDTYQRVHLAGPKKNYRFRLDTPERACKAKIRSVNIGALLGLADWRSEAFFTGLHAAYLQDKYPDVMVSISPPRIRPHAGSFSAVMPVSDRHLVQVILATRLFLPYAGITLSTRESSGFRNNLIPLGITKMSAGVTTAVGGHSEADPASSQFEIADNRTVLQMRHAVLAAGYQPVFKDWMTF